MNNDLNLLPSSAKFQAEKVKWRKGAKNYLWVLGILWLVLVLIVVVWWLVVKYGLAGVEKKYQRVLANYKALAGEVWENEKIKYQTKVVGEILVGRFEYGQTLRKIDELFPSQKIKIDDFELTEKKKFLVKGKIDDGPNVDDLEKRISEINQGGSEIFSGAKLLSLSVDGPVWSFEMEVNIK